MRVTQVSPGQSWWTPATGQNRYGWALEIAPGAQITTYIHPDTEEAMVIVEGQLEAVLGNEVINLGPGDTVLAPVGVKHGFINRSGENAVLLASFTKTSFQRVAADS